MSTAASISKAMHRSGPIQLNYDYVEYLSPWFYKSDPIRKLFVHQLTEDELHRKFVLHGIRFAGCDDGKAKALKLFPESKEQGLERVRANLARMDEAFKTQQEELVAHVVVSHGFHIHHTSTELGSPDHGHAEYCSITGYVLD